MHPKVNEIFKAHQEWLNRGGDQAISAVQTANLMSLIDKALNESDAESYQRGSGDGYRIGRNQGWLQSVRANNDPAIGQAPATWKTADEWDSHVERRTPPRPEVEPAIPPASDPEAS